jgi:hypothetical protein
LGKLLLRSGGRNVQFKLNAENDQEKNRFIGYLKAHPQVFYIIDSIGVCNLIVEFLTEGSDDLQKIIKELKDKFPNIIHSYDPLLITKEHNHSYFPKDLVEKQKEEHLKDNGHLLTKTIGRDTDG